MMVDKQALLFSHLPEAKSENLKLQNPLSIGILAKQTQKAGDIHCAGHLIFIS